MELYQSWGVTTDAPLGPILQLFMHAIGERDRNREGDPVVFRVALALSGYSRPLPSPFLGPPFRHVILTHCFLFGCLSRFLGPLIVALSRPSHCCAFQAHSSPCLAHLFPPFTCADTI
jgi:hypothetical protein